MFWSKIFYAMESIKLIHSVGNIRKALISSLQEVGTESKLPYITSLHRSGKREVD